jgi:hypothetical protein
MFGCHQWLRSYETIIVPNPLPPRVSRLAHRDSCDRQALTCQASDLAAGAGYNVLPGALRPARIVAWRAGGETRAVYPPGIEDSTIVHVTQIASNNNPRPTPKQPISPSALLSLRMPQPATVTEG